MRFSTKKYYSYDAPKKTQKLNADAISCKKNDYKKIFIF